MHFLQVVLIYEFFCICWLSCAQMLEREPVGGVKGYERLIVSTCKVILHWDNFEN